MKNVRKEVGLMVRLGATAVALLLGQQAMALGTDAGTQVDNTATVNYSVGLVGQTALTDTVSFVVDRRVDFTLTVVDDTVEVIAPGQQDVWVDFLVAHTGNSALDFNVDVVHMSGGTFGQPTAVTDNVDLNNLEWAVSTQTVLGGDADPAQGGPQFIDELAEDESIRIRVWGDADLLLALANGDASGVALTITAAEPATVGLGTDLQSLADTALGVENVFADAGNDGTETANDGWQVAAPDLAVTKDYAVISDPLGSGYPIPGAVVEYTVTVVNSNATVAEDVYLTDVIDGDVTLNLNVAAYAGEDVSVVNGATTLPCNVEDNNDGDGCDLVGGNALTVGDVAEMATDIDVAGNTTLTIRYQVTIPTP
jgi:uncharacterized repeat protein (TIGR01451 family)